jgi:hypothetical protein
MHQNHTHGEIMSKLNLGNAYSHSVENIVSSFLLSNIKTKKVQFFLLFYTGVRLALFLREGVHCEQSVKENIWI